MPSDSGPINHGHEIGRAKPRQCRGAKARIMRQEPIRRGGEIGKIAPPPARDADLFARLAGVIQNQNAPGPTRLHDRSRAKKPGSACTQNDNIGLFHIRAINGPWTGRQGPLRAAGWHLAGPNWSDQQKGLPSAFNATRRKVGYVNPAYLAPLPQDRVQHIRAASASRFHNLPRGGLVVSGYEVRVFTLPSALLIYYTTFPCCVRKGMRYSPHIEWLRTRSALPSICVADWWKLNFKPVQNLSLQSTTGHHIRRGAARLVAA